jgi:hypothetical protein
VRICPVIALFSATLFVSSALLFLVQPMLGKFVLPLAGGTPQVWITMVLFFQSALLLGYAYGHWATRRLPLRGQLPLHLAVLLVALVVLPLGVPTNRPPVSADPLPWLIGLLVVTVGLPFFAVSAQGPVLQRWLSRTRHPSASDPYFLFAASNAGSLIGLLAYPLAVEPLIGLEEQGRAWSAAYIALIALVAGCAIAALRRPAASGAGEAGPTLEAGMAAPPQAAAVPGPVTWSRRALWLALALVPSSYLLGTTAYITRDLAPVPLLWVLPLAAYLLSFILAFAPRADAQRLVRMARIALPGFAILVTYTVVLGTQRPLWFLLPLHLAGLLVAATLCHARLAADRPGTAHLTEFYLWIAAGGALGGVFNGLIAPLAFPGLVEYPIAIVAACLLRPRPPDTRPGLLEFLLRDPRITRWMDLAVPVLIGLAVAVVLFAVRSPDPDDAFTYRSLVLGVAVGLALNLARRPLRFGLAIAAIFLAGTVSDGSSDRTLLRDRSFFGIYTVRASDEGRFHEMIDGTTVHGAERIGDHPRPEPLSYYGRRGPVGQALAALPAGATERTGVIGLGTGTLACYARPTDRWTFYEIDPTVERIARDPGLFTFLSACPGRKDVVLGDGRQSLVRAAAERFSLVTVDAFISDTIPVHLMTREAVSMYLARLRPDGRLLLNLSNRYLELESVVGNIARSLGLTCVAQSHEVSADEEDRRLESSTWALLAPRAAALGRLPSDRRWHPCARSGARVWTDDYSNVLGILRAG